MREQVIQVTIAPFFDWGHFAKVGAARTPPPGSGDAAVSHKPSATAANAKV